MRDRFSHAIRYREYDFDARGTGSVFYQRARRLRFLCPLMVLISAALVANAGAHDRNIYFHEEYQKALQEARLTQKPIFLEFRCAP